MKHTLKNCLILFTLVLFYGCAAKKPAPVEKNYEAEKPVKVEKKTLTCPDIYTVKDGDVLFFRVNT